MTILAEDLRELKRAINGAAEKINCIAQISVRPVCIGDGTQDAFGIFKVSEEGSELIRVESSNGTLIEGATITDCV